MWERIAHPLKLSVFASRKILNRLHLCSLVAITLCAVKHDLLEARQHGSVGVCWHSLATEERQKIYSTVFASWHCFRMCFSTQTGPATLLLSRVFCLSPPTPATHPPHANPSRKWVAAVIVDRLLVADEAKYSNVVSGTAPTPCSVSPRLLCRARRPSPMTDCSAETFSKV